jgi:phage-related protein
VASTAFVEVVADVSQVDGQIETGFDRAIREVERQLPGVEVGADVDPQSIDRLARTLTSDIRGIESSLEGVDVRTIVSEESVRAVQNRIATLDQQLQAIDVEVDPNVNPIAVERARASLRRLQATLPPIEVPVDVDVDGADVSGLGDELSARVRPELDDAGRDSSRTFSDAFGGFLRSPAGGVIISGAVVAALTTAVSAASALGVGALVANVAFQGFGDAVAAIIEGDQEKIDEALQGLSVSARNVAIDIQELLPALSDFQNQVQNRFFLPLTEAIPGLRDAFGSLEEPILLVAEEMGKFVQTIVDSLSDEGSVEDFKSILEDTAVILPVLAELIGGVLSGAFSTLAFILDSTVTSVTGFQNAVTNTGVYINTNVNQMIQTFQNLYQNVTTVFSNLQSIIATRVGQIFINARDSFANLRNTATNEFNTIRNNVSSAFSNLRDRVATGVASIATNVRNGFNNARQAASDAVNQLASNVRSGINNAVSFVAQLPSRARSAVGSLGSVLYGAGQSLIDGFVRGIRNSIGRIAAAARDAVQTARNYFPFSPAKVGPLSGKGYTTFAGKALIDGFAKGMRARSLVLEFEARRAAAIAAEQLAAVNATPSAANLSSSISVSGRQTPSANVTVMLGNRFINEYVESIVSDRQAARDRLMSQGIRR